MNYPAESPLEFPCSFPLKVFGRNADDFEAFVVAIVRRHVPQLDQKAISSRPSKNGNYLAVTITFTAESQAQLDALYQELSDSERIVMTL
jgi:putative lipoic acid-binding regulatory protein